MTTKYEKTVPSPSTLEAESSQNKYLLFLQSASLSSNMTLEEVAELYDNMRKETLLKQYCDTKKIKERKAGKYTQFYILTDGKQVTAKTRKELINKLFEAFCGDSVITLEEAYKEWMMWRANINTPSKTLKENQNEWII